MRSSKAAIAIVALSLLLTSCTPAREDMVDHSLDPHAAKAIAQQMERRIVGLIPPDHVGEVTQQATGALLRCTGEGIYLWAGGTTVTVVGAPDFERILEEMTNRFAAKGFTVRDVTGDDRPPTIQIIGEHGAGYLVGPTRDRTVIDIDSFSPCFHLPEGMSSRGGF